MSPQVTTSSDQSAEPTIGLWTMGSLFVLSTFPRALLISLLPVVALRMLGTPEAVSIFYTLVSAAGIAASICIPTLGRTFGASGLVLLGAISMMACGALFLVGTLPWFVVGMILYLFGYAAMEIGLTLFVLKVVKRDELTFFEPRRVIFMVASYASGPWLGLTLATHVADWVPFALCTATAAITLLVVPLIGLNRIDAAPPPKSSNPLRYIRRFFSQPRLRHAWGLTLGRAAWWTMFFIYTPIYAVTYGLGEVVGGAIVSAGVAIVWTVPLWARLGRRIGLRKMLSWSFFAVGLVMMSMGLTAEVAWLGAATLIFAAIVVTPLDAGGNIPFLRAVRARERAEMTGVFATYRDTAQLLPPAVFSGVLQVFALPAVFVTSGISMLGFALLARFLPRRL